MKYFHRNYVFLLIASALTTVLWSLTYTTSRFRTLFSLMMSVDALPKRLVLQKKLDNGQTAREGILTTNYYFPLIASALTTVLRLLTYTTTRYRTRFSLMMAVDGTAEPVSYTHLDVYKRQH